MQTRLSNMNGKYRLLAASALMASLVSLSAQTAFNSPALADTPVATPGATANALNGGDPNTGQNTAQNTPTETIAPNTNPDNNVNGAGTMNPDATQANPHDHSMDQAQTSNQIQAQPLSDQQQDKASKEAVKEQDKANRQALKDQEKAQKKAMKDQAKLQKEASKHKDKDPSAPISN